jgi:UDP-N-acetyl-2-amino-2-deoxyglucuronate dehydrogenase
MEGFMKKKTNPANVGAAVIGLGRGMSHVRCYSGAENCDLIAVCDINEEKARAVAEEFGVDYYTDYQEMLKRDDIDLVSVVTPSGMHCEMADVIALAGKHCLVEKPLDVTLPPIDRTIALYDEKDLKLGCIFQNRLEDAIQLTKKAVEEGLLGELVVCNIMVKWYRNDAYYEANGGWRGTWRWDGGGSLMNQSVHTIDIMQWLMGGVESVFAKVKVVNHKIETEDIGCALVKFKNGAYGTITGSTATYPGFGTAIEVHGTKGGICVKDNQITSWKIDRSDTPAADKDEQKARAMAIAAEEAEMIAKTQKAPRTGAANDPAAIGNNTTFFQVQDMVNAVKENRQPIICGSEGRNAVELILAIYESSQTGKEIFL